MKFNRLLKIISLIILCLSAVHSQSVFSQQEDTTHVLGRSHAIPMTVFSNKDTIINEDTIIVKDVHPQDSPEDHGFLITSSGDGGKIKMVRVEMPIEYLLSSITIFNFAESVSSLSVKWGNLGKEIV